MYIFFIFFYIKDFLAFQIRREVYVTCNNPIRKEKKKMKRQSQI